MITPLRFLLAPGVLLAATSLHAGVMFTFENPKVQFTSVVGATTVTFEGAQNPLFPGTFSGGYIAPADQYGGAGGSGSYFNATGATLTLSEPQNYVGFWWSAGNSNSITFQDANNVNIAQYNITDIEPFLSPAYKGNPNPPFEGFNSNEFYVYLNFTTTGGSEISKVLFAGDGFELDNVSTFDQPIAPPGNGTSVPDTGSTLLLSSFAFTGLAMLKSKLKKSSFVHG